ncbi:hypothetical protein bcere0029_54460 [Bacillus cereus AH1272]|nr:hypothetical protein bcere0029_54460 [Bacillus cereus AH1272]EEL90496.1 hypothetical protein bcere0030_55770 [Bacillus cereus AH1273]OJE52725.1 hypothetical protein BAQ48_07770 [Bacillus luti]
MSFKKTNRGGIDMNQFKTLLKTKITKDKVFHILENENEYNIKIEKVHTINGVESAEEVFEWTPSKYRVLKLTLAGGTSLAAIGSWISKLF